MSLELVKQPPRFPLATTTLSDNLVNHTAEPFVKHCFSFLDYEDDSEAVSSTCKTWKRLMNSDVLLSFKFHFPEHRRTISIQLQHNFPGTDKRELFKRFLISCNDFNRMALARLTDLYEEENSEILRGSFKSSKASNDSDEKEFPPRNNVQFDPSGDTPRAVRFAEFANQEFSPAHSLHSSMHSNNSARSSVCSVASATDSQPETPTANIIVSPGKPTTSILKKTPLVQPSAQEQRSFTFLQTISEMNTSALGFDASRKSYSVSRRQPSVPPALKAPNSDHSELSSAALSVEIELTNSDGSNHESEAPTQPRTPTFHRARPSISQPPALIVEDPDRPSLKAAPLTVEPSPANSESSVVEFSPSSSRGSFFAPRLGELSFHPMATLVEVDTPIQIPKHYSVAYGSPKSIYSDQSIIDATSSAPRDSVISLDSPRPAPRTKRDKPYEASFTSYQKAALEKITSYCNDDLSATKMSQKIGNYQPENLTSFLLNVSTMNFDVCKLAASLDLAKLNALLAKYPDSKTELLKLAKTCHNQLAKAKDFETDTLAKIQSLSPEESDLFLIRDNELVSTTFVATSENIAMLSSVIDQIPDGKISNFALYTDRLKKTHVPFEEFRRDRKDIITLIDEMMRKDAASCCTLL